MQWRSDTAAAIRDAQATASPLLVRVTEAHEFSDLADAQQRAYADPLVKAIVDNRFVPLRMPRSTTNLPLLEKWGAHTAFGMYLLVVSPDGDAIGEIDPTDAANPGALVKRLTQLYHAYRARLFDKQVGPRLEKSAFARGDLKPVLRVIRRTVMVEADQAMIKLLDHAQLSDHQRRGVDRTLALLSTKAATLALLDRAEKDEYAADALKRITPAAAEFLLPEIASAEPDSARFFAAYSAAAAVTQYPNPKDRHFWKVAPEKARAEELDRLHTHVDDRAAAWQRTYGRIR